MNVTIAGAHEQIAFRLARLLAAEGNRVIGLIRNPDHATEVSRTGAAPVRCDLERGARIRADQWRPAQRRALCRGAGRVRCPSRTGLRIRPDHQLPCFSGDGVIPFRQHFEPATEAPAGSVVGHPRCRRRVTRRSRRLRGRPGRLDHCARSSRLQIGLPIPAPRRPGFPQLVGNPVSVVDNHEHRGKLRGIG